jgi:HNH endonuclease
MKCYLCDEVLRPLDSIGTNNHKEHIIPNAIGGRLKAADILCESCGSCLGGKIDINFVKIFFPITERINLAKERGDNNNSINGSMLIDGNLLQVNYKNFRVFPANPFYKVDEANKVVLIYAYNTKMGTNFCKKVKQYLKELGNDCSQYEFTIIDNLVGNVEWEFKMDNKSFDLGLNKIATEFAILNKIDKYQ